MDSQLSPNTPETSSTTEPVDPKSLPEISPMKNSRRTNQQNASQVMQSLRQFFDNMGGIFKENQQLLAIITASLVALIALRIVLAIVGTLNDIPLLTSFFELVGIGYTAWFVNRYLLKASDRQELSQQVKSLKTQVIGDKPVFKSHASGSRSMTATQNMVSQGMGAAQGITDESQDMVAKGIASVSSAVEDASNLSVKKSVIVNRPSEQLYEFWHNFENLPQIMNHLESVRVLDNQRSHWVMKAPMGTHVEWDAVTIEDNAPNTIVWRSLEGADVENIGSVSFVEQGNGATEVKVTMEYTPPAGAVGAAVADLFGENPDQQLEEDLNRFKQLMEATPSTMESPSSL